jgi:RHS repeat-associated protein
VKFFSHRAGRRGALVSSPRSLLTWMRQGAGPLASVQLLAFGVTTVCPGIAHATGESKDVPVAVRDSTATEELKQRDSARRYEGKSDSLSLDPDSAKTEPKRIDGTAQDELSTTVQKDSRLVDAAPPSAANDSRTLALPTGADKSGVSAQAISLPKGAATTQGMGESFSTQLSTGVATFNVPFALPQARGTVSPTLGLAYSSAGGTGLAGVGWDVGVPYIARQTDRGLPTYRDGAGFDFDQDRFVFNGGQELVPICQVDELLQCKRADGSAAALPNEVMPAWSQGAVYFRPRVEGAFMRFFWLKDHRSWRVQDKSGMSLELGMPLDGSGRTDGLETNPDVPSEIYRWHVTRQYDMYGTVNDAVLPPVPHNVVVYRYRQDGGRAYLADVFDTTPAAAPASTDTSRYAHHTHLVWESRTDPSESYRSGWKIETRLRLAGVDVTSKTFTGGEVGARHLVRRYHLAYDANYHASLLASVQVEGRCAAAEANAPAEDNLGLLPATSCPVLPAMKFGYSHVAASAGPAGFEEFDRRVVKMSSAPPHSVDEATADFFDVNSDGLPDLLATMPGQYSGGFGTFFGGAHGLRDGFGSAVSMSLASANGDAVGNVVLSNSNVTPLDLDGDGTIDLLNMPAVRTYSVYTPVGNTWLGRSVSLGGQSPKIDFGRDAPNTRVVDVNFDGLTDLVVSTGQELQTFLSLGRYPGGDGQFGQARQSGVGTSDISNEPLHTCLPRAAQALSFGNPEFQLGDLNGDGITDIVHVYHANIKYWPGRGNGVFGTGARSCSSGTFDDSRHVAMAHSPDFAGNTAGVLRVDDVNGDGFDDLVRIRNTAIDIWLNIDGRDWAPRYTIDGTPFNSDAADRARVMDVNGSGTRDVVWATASDYRYIDLLGGQRPQLLTRIENGLGKSTELEYSSSTEEMLTAEAFGGDCNPEGAPWQSPWCSKMPTVAHMVKRVTDRDNLVVAGRSSTYVTEYDYRDPVFEGRQREFRGFRKARSRRIGDQNSPTDVTESTFLLGECGDETDDGTDDCSTGERWRDNPKEALKGLPVVTETYDEAGTRLNTALTTYRLRQLYVGLDGRAVRQAFASSTRTYRYDTDAGPVGSRIGGTFTAVELEVAPDSSFDPETNPLASPAGLRATGTMTLPFRHYTTATTAVLENQSIVDFFGNRVVAIDRGCTSGGACPTFATTDDRGLVPDEIIYSYSLSGRRADDPTGWLWRTSRTYVRGSVDQTRRHETTQDYDIRGAATGGSSVRGNALELDRFNAVSANGKAPDPANRSIGTTVPLPTREYDDLGNLTKTRLALASAADRCSTLSYDALPDNAGKKLGYSQFPTLETSYVGDDCAGKALTTSASYDRGTGQIVTALDMALQPSQFDYDGFGRLTALWRPDPASAALSARPSVKIEYSLPSDLGVSAYSIIHTSTQDGSDPSQDQYLETWSFLDGMGRARATIADDDVDGKYIVSGITTFDAKGGAEKRYLAAFSSGAPVAFDLASVPTTSCGTQTYDAFGRGLLTFDVDGGASCRGTITLEVRYHALSKDAWDAADREVGGLHSATPATETQDGHGRSIARTERVKAGANIQLREIRTQYLPSGEPVIITRVVVDGAAVSPVVRWMAYDTLGRMTLNVDAHTSAGFVATPTTPPPASLKAWRYVYSDAGDLVGTSDARGCGANYFYDGVGRLTAEDYSPCLGHQGAYTAPDFANQRFMEALYTYDSDASATPADKPTGFSYEPSYSRSSLFLNGRLAATFDRGQAQLFSYDGRGRARRLDKQLARPQAGDAQGQVDAALYASTWYTKTRQYDGADRETATSTGARVAELLGAGAKSEVSTTYTRRGTVGQVNSTYGTLISSVKRDADGLVTEIKYGDAATTTKTQSYDNRRRLTSVVSERVQPALWATIPASYQPAPTLPPAAPSAFQLQLQDTEIQYDSVGNPIHILDHRQPAEWPSGAKPVSRDFEYDDLNRLTRSASRYQLTDASTGSDTFVSPFSAELAGVSDPRRPAPAPHKLPPTRVQEQTYAYDWLGNTTATDDDLHVAFDRSLGTIINNNAAGKPYQLLSSSQSTSPTQAGTVAATYDSAGNLLTLAVTRTVTTCVGGNCTLSYDYQWDELGRLTRARRKEGAAFVADLRYTYDVGDQRVRKTSLAGGVTRHALYVFDTLDVRGTQYNAAAAPNDYSLGPDTEVPSLLAHGVRLARIVLEQPADGEPRLVSTNRQHVFLTLTDSLGSSSATIDHATGELVELTTYQPYGATESDYRTDRWKSFREDYKFTGKEEDVEVGLQYFGKRYLSPYLGRWISADPLAVHVPGEADPNLYAYVSGRVLKNTDPLGLAPTAEQAFLMKAIDVVGAGLKNPQLANQMKALIQKTDVEWGDLGSGAGSRAMVTDVGWFSNTLTINKKTVPGHSMFWIGATTMHEGVHIRDNDHDYLGGEAQEGRGYAAQTFLNERGGGSAGERTRLWHIAVDNGGAAPGSGDLFRREFAKTYAVLDQLQNVAEGKSSYLTGFKLEGGGTLTDIKAKEMVANYLTQKREDWNKDLVRAEATVQTKMGDIAKSDAKLNGVLHGGGAGLPAGQSGVSASSIENEGRQTLDQTKDQ